LVFFSHGLTPIFTDFLKFVRIREIRGKEILLQEVYFRLIYIQQYYSYYFATKQWLALLYNTFIVRN